MKPFSCRHKNNKGPVEMPYSEIPDDVLDDPEILAEWALKAFEGALAAKRLKGNRFAA
jgi:DNA transformation protein and related proteins